MEGILSSDATFPPGMEGLPLRLSYVERPTEYAEVPGSSLVYGIGSLSLAKWYGNFIQPD